MYKAISYFKDMKDNMHSYNPGDTFPRDGLSVSDERIAELSTANNRRGKPVIELVKPKKTKKVETTEIENGPDEITIEEPKPKKRGKKKNVD